MRVRGREDSNPRPLVSHVASLPSHYASHINKNKMLSFRSNPWSSILVPDQHTTGTKIAPEAFKFGPGTKIAPWQL
jgi:hypothetical protein